MLTAASAQGLWIRAMPVMFVLLWSTGFIGARFGLPYAEPFTFLAIRFACTLVVLYVLVRLFQEAWPAGWRLRGHIGVAGVLVHGIYLGGVFFAIDRGMPPAIAALIVGLQPLLTAALARAWLGEIITRMQWVGILLGLVGITLVLGEQLDPEDAEALFSEFGVSAIISALMALSAISVGTLYQKRFCTSMPLTTGTFIQFTGAAAVLLLGSFLFETREIEWNLQFTLALTWLIFGLSIAAILLLMAMIRRGEASRVASLFYLVPPVTAVEAWILFDDQLGPFALTGIAVAVFGVALAVRQSAGDGNAAAPADPPDRSDNSANANAPARRRPIVFYDGGCPICRREIGFYQRLDRRRQQIDWRDIHADPNALTEYPVDWETAMRRFHCVDTEGRLRHGVDAFAVAWEHLPGGWLLARLIRGTGLIHPLERLYAWYADRRWQRRCPLER